MAKSDKSTVVRRTQEILRLILAGGEFEDIRQYASGQGWNISDRQLRRYQEHAYQRIAEATNRDQRQLLARHLMQRRALYARALKTSDVRTALQVLRDEAVLEGLYPSLKGGMSSGKEQPLLTSRPPISRADRFKRTLIAEERGDKKEIALMEHLTPIHKYPLSDLMIPRQLLHTMALKHAAEQLDHAAMYLAALWQVSVHGENEDGWDLIGSCHAFRYKVGRDGWLLFAERLGINGDELIRQNHRGSMLELFGDRIYEQAPTDGEMAAKLAAEGEAPDMFCTAEDVARSWRDLLDQVLRD